VVRCSSAKAPSPPRAQGRRGRKTGGEVRSGKNAIVKAGRREERMRVRAPEREKEEEGGRRGEKGVRRMPSPLTAGDPVF